MPSYSPLTETDIENYLCRQAKLKLKARAVKYSTPGRRAAPDRLLLWPVNMTAFVECKRPGKEPTPKQWQELNRLWDSGHNATWIDTKDQADSVVRHLSEEGKLTKEFTELLHEVM